MSTRYSSVMMNTVTYNAWLVIDEQGSMRMTRAKPQISARERRVAFKITVPRAIFKTPELRVEATVNGEAPEIDMVEVTKSIEDLMIEKGMVVEIVATGERE